MKRVSVKRILRPSNGSRVTHHDDQSILMHSTDGSGQVFHASQFDPLNGSSFSVQTTGATALFSNDILLLNVDRFASETMGTGSLGALGGTVWVKFAP